MKRFEKGISAITAETGFASKFNMPPKNQEILIFVINSIFIMPTALNINDILSQVRKLGKEDQLTPLEKLVLLIRKSEKKDKSTKLSSISGIGAEIWKGVNIDEYLGQERQW